MRFDHDQLRTLAAVAREGSFERAAMVLNITTSAVSQRIKLLEERVGRLLMKRGVPSTPTESGQALVQLAEQTALLEHDAVQRLGLGSEGRRHSLTVAVNSDSLDTWFVQASLQFSVHSTCTLDLQVEDQDHTEQLLRSGAVHAAVTTLQQPVQGCRIHPLGNMRYVAACSPDFRDRHFPKGMTGSALADAPVIVFNRKDALQARFVQKRIGTARWQPPVWWVPSSSAFVKATLAGLGWTLLPLQQAEPYLEDGQLVPLRQREWEDVPLFWQHWRLASETMVLLTDAVLSAASAELKRPRRMPPGPSVRD